MSEKIDLKTLERLAAQMIKDGSRVRALHPSAVFSIADIIKRCIGAPLMWPSRSAGADAADAIYPGNPAMRAAFNAGVKWAVENYHPSYEDNKEGEPR